MSWEDFNGRVDENADGENANRYKGVHRWFGYGQGNYDGACYWSWMVHIK